MVEKRSCSLAAVQGCMCSYIPAQAYFLQPQGPVIWRVHDWYQGAIVPSTLSLVATAHITCCILFPPCRALSVRRARRMMRMRRRRRQWMKLAA